MDIVHNTDRVVNLLYYWRDDLRGLVHLVHHSQHCDFTLCRGYVTASGHMEDTFITCVECLANYTRYDWSRAGVV